ncbi:TonB-dependent receptor [Sphingomonas yantingensis]|uniref:Iron complex outermembrane receptor protein n=1 Tax=Sphingomonas yantingensis TaxID=1241761 RepID=A0A7W9ASP5_9SPHN|nr:TonB-dependent receptor [Sphingomonas yantingensis]MBB5699696.1 iron complex outermembrane receptor protein [Sphingomonas yantingensis]
MKKTSKWLVSSAALAAAGAWAPAAMAQTAVPQSDTAPTLQAAPATETSSTSPAASQQAADTDTGDIIVTAQRRNESVMKVPVSVTVVSAEALTKNGINDLRAVSKLAPSLQPGQDNQFSIRGIGTATFADTVEASVTQVIDDVALGSRYFASAGFYDIERVEVLNGPQGLLFGKNASAGVVNITTTAPKLGEASLSADLEGTTRARDGKDGLGILVRGTANVPVGDNSALRINAIYSSQDAITQLRSTGNGRAENDVGQRAFRAKFLTKPTDNLSIYLIGDYGKFTGISGTFDFTYRSLGAGSQYPAILAGAGVLPSDRNLTSVVNADYYRDLETGGLQGKVAYALDSGVEISNIAAWKTYSLGTTFDSDFTPVDFLDRNANTSSYDQFSNELRVTLPAENRLTGQFGLYYFYSKNNFTNQRGGSNGLPGFVIGGFPFCVGATPVAGPPPACNVRNRYFLGQDSAGRNTNESFAGFGQFTYAVTDTLKVIAGGRVTRDKVTLDLTENVNPYFVTLGVPNNRFSGSESNTNFSWKLGVDWQPTPTTLVYGFYGHGYKGPGFSNASPAPGADLGVAPEISKGGEVGLKQALFDRRVNLSFSAFYTRFDNLQVQAFDAALQTVVLQNAAQATTKGIDFSMQARPVKGLTLSAGGTLLDAKYDRYPGRQCYPGQQAASCAVNGTFDVSGRQVPQSAKFTGVLSADYEAPLTGDLSATVGGNFYHRSPLLSEYAPGATIPTWNTFDFNLGVRSDRWSASLFCKNCFNELRPVSIEVEAGDGINAGALSYVQRWSYDSVRTIGLRLGLQL